MTVQTTAKGRRLYRWLAGILTTASIIGMGFVVLVPLGEKPDEPSHLSRAIHLARYGVEPSTAEYPVFPDIVTYEAVQPPVYYHVAAWVLRLLPDVTWELRPSRLFGCVDRSTRFELDDGDHEIPEQAVLIRIVGLVMVLCAGAVLFVAARLVFPDGYGAVLTVAFQILLPQMLFISTAASNDGLAVLAGTVVLALAVWAARSGKIVAAVLAGAAAVTALSVKLNISGYVLATPWLFIGWQRKRLTRQLAGFLFGAFAPFLVAAFFSGPGGLVDFDFIIHRIHWRVGSVSGKEYISSVPTLLASYWAQFGWMDLDAHHAVRVFWAVILVSATIGWGVGHRRPYLPLWPLWAMFAAIFGGWAFSLGSTNQIQGRFLFPYSGIIALLLSAGLLGLSRSRKAVVSILLGLVLANCMCLWQLWERYRPIDDQGDLILASRQCYSDRVVIETLTEGYEHGQSIWCEYPNLAAIDVMFAGKAPAEALIELNVADAISGYVFRTTTRQVREITPDTYTRFRFDPIRKSDNRGLMIRFRLSPPDSGGDLSLRYALGDPYLAGVRYLDGDPRDGDLRFVAWCSESDSREVMR